MVRATRVEQIGTLLKSFLNEITDQPVVLFGSSFGSTVAIEVGYQMPEKVSGLVLQGGFVYRPLKGLEKLLARVVSLLPLRAGGIPFLEAAIKLQHFDGFKNSAPGQWQRFLQNISAAKCDLAACHALAIHEVDHREKAARLDLPVLLLDGETDPLVGPEARKCLYEAFPVAQKELISGGAHLLPYSHPAEITRHLRIFLAKVFGS